MTLHAVLNDATRGLLGARELALLKPSCLLINTSRGSLIDEAALVAALQKGQIAGAALDVYYREPLPTSHPFRTLPNVIATPHIGYVIEENYRQFYGDAVEDIQAWAKGLRSEESRLRVIADQLGEAVRGKAMTPLINQLQETSMTHHHSKVGFTEVFVFLDGILPVPASLVLAGNEMPVEQMIQKHIVPATLEWSNNVFLVPLARKNFLIDVGGGDLFAEGSGHLISSMAAAGFAPSDITDILLTHLHPDHTGGLVKDGQMVFPDAQIHVARRELDYWLDLESRANAVEHHNIFFENIDRSFMPYLHAVRIEPFDDGAELTPRLRSLPLPGHTPGHTAFVLSSHDDAVTFTGDLFNDPAQVPHPDLKLTFDWNAERAIVTRRKTLEDAAVRHLTIAPAHAPFPGFSTIRKDGFGYLLEAGNR